MGMTPRSQVSTPTFLELAKRRYLHDMCTLDEFEHEVEFILLRGLEDKVPPPHAPPKPVGMRRVDY